jgi:hypothetical protein
MRGIQEEIVDDPSQRCAVPSGMIRQGDGCSGVLLRRSRVFPQNRRNDVGLRIAACRYHQQDLTRVRPTHVV